MAPVTPLRDTFNDSLNKGASPPVYSPLQREACSDGFVFRT